SLDATFGSGGLVANRTSIADSRAWGAAIYPTTGTANDGKIVAAGDSYDGTKWDFVTARYLSSPQPAISGVTSTTPNGSYGIGATINVTVNFSEPVTLAGGNLIINLSTGGTATIAPFTAATSAAGTYTVAAGQNSPDLNALSPLALGSGAALRDAAG